MKPMDMMEAVLPIVGILFIILIVPLFFALAFTVWAWGGYFALDQIQAAQSFFGG